MGNCLCKWNIRKEKMNQVIRDALKAKYTGELAEANANIKIYLRNPMGIGEHSDIISAVNEQVEKAVNAQEKLDYVNSLKY